MSDEENKLKADAVMEFVNGLIGAFDANFVEDHKPSLATLYRCAQHHVKDTYNAETIGIIEQWGEQTASDCHNGNSQLRG